MYSFYRCLHWHNQLFLKNAQELVEDEWICFILKIHDTNRYYSWVDVDFRTYTNVWFKQYLFDMELN